jgi:peptidoglycan hydrolase CwlO-like protein
MPYAGDRMRQTNDRPETNHSINRRVTVQEAAVLLGLSEDAVRSRLKRGTLGKEKAPDGTVYVVLGVGESTDRPTTSQPTNDQSTTSQATDQNAQAMMQAHLDSLQDQIDHLRQQLEEAHEANRENRRIIAGLVQRVPELEPALEQRGSTVSAATDAGEGEAPSGQEKRSFLRRFFGL